VFPDVAPLCQSSCRERLQNHASPLSRVSRSASSFIQASISTRPLAASCTIAGLSGISHRYAEATQLFAQASEPAWILVEDRREQRRLRDPLPRDMGRVARAAGRD
jgi:hypothetical protein